MSLKKLWLGLVMTVIVSSANASCFDFCNYGCRSGFSCFDFCSANPFDDWTFYGDWLYWRVRRSELDFAIPYDESNLNISGKVYEVCPEYSSGYRLGFKKGCGCYDFGMRYTEFTPSFHDSVTKNNGELAKTRLGNFWAVTTNGDFTYAEGGYRVEFREVDIEFGAVTWSNYCFYTRVFSGFKCAFIDQNFEALYGDFDTIELENDYLKYDQQLDAYGFYAGGDAQVAILRCLDLYGSVSFGSYWANIVNKLKQFRTTTPADVTVQQTIVDLRDTCHKFVNNFNLSIGLEYQLPCCCFTDFTVTFGYEFHHFFCMLDFLNLNDTETSFDSNNNTNFSLDRNSDGLGFDGFFLRVAANF